MNEISDKIARYNQDIVILQMQAVTGNMTHAESRAEIEQLKIKRDELYVRYIATQAQSTKA